MAIRLLEPFDSFSGGADLARAGWTFASGGVSAGTQTGRSGSGLAFGLYNNNDINRETLARSDLGNFAAGLVTMGIKFDGTSITAPNFSSQHHFLAIRDGSTVQLGLKLNTDLSISVQRNTTTLGTTAAGVFTMNNTWHTIELEFVIHASAGSLTLRYDGVVVLTLTGQNTQQTTNAYINGLWFASPRDGSGAGGRLWLDDLVVRDISGSFNNANTSDMRIDTLRPNADSAVAWTRSAGTSNNAAVNKTLWAATPNISSSTPGQTDLYGLADLAITPSTIHALCVAYTPHRSDGGARTMRCWIKSAGVIAYGATITPAQTTSTGWRDYFEVDPATASPWTAAALNAVEIGVELVA